MLLVKVVRTINDNGASVFYMWSAGELAVAKDEVNGNSLALYAWIGVGVYAIQLPASLMLGQMVDTSSESNKDKKKKSGETNQKVNMSTLLTKTIILFIINNSFGYGCLHAFYPNISKFF